MGRENQEVLNIVLRVKDEATEILQSLGTTLVDQGNISQQAVTEITEAVDRLGESVTTTAEKDVPKLGMSFEEVGKATKKAFRHMSTSLRSFQRGQSLARRDTVALADNIISNFAMGGPVYGSISSVITLMGLLVGQTKEARKAQAKLRAEALRDAKRLNSEAIRGAERTQEALESILIAGVIKSVKIVSAKHKLVGEKYDEEAALSKILRDKQIDDLEEVVSAKKEAMRQEEVRLDKLEKKQKIYNKMMLMSEEERLGLEMSLGSVTASKDILQFKGAADRMPEITAVKDSIENNRKAVESAIASISALQDNARQDNVIKELAAQQKIKDEALAKEKELLDEQTALREAQSAALTALYEGEENRIVQLERIAALSEEDKKYGAQILKIQDLRSSGLDDFADRAQRLLDREIESLRIAEEKKEIDKAAAEVLALNEGLDTRINQLLLEEKGISSSLLGLYTQIAAKKKAGADVSKLAIVYDKESAKLIKIEQEEARRKAEAKREYVDRLREEISLASELTETGKQRLQNEIDIADAAKQGGEEAANLMRELIKLEEERTAELEEQKQITQDRMKEETQLKRLMSGGHMDKGLASRRERRKAELHMSKRKKELAGRRMSSEYMGGFDLMGEAGAGGPIQLKEPPLPPKRLETGLFGEPLPGGGQGVAEEGGAGESALETEIKSLKEELGLTESELSRAADGMESVTDIVKEGNDSAKGLADGVEGMSSSLDDLTGEIGNAAKSVGNTVSILAFEVEVVKNELADLKKSLADSERIAGG